MRWFGETWGAPINESCERAAAPVGAHCTYCEKPIEEADQGLLILNASTGLEEPDHLECVLRTFLGPHWRDHWANPREREKEKR